MQLILFVMAVVGMLGSMTIFGALSPTAPLVGMVPFSCALVFFVYKERKARRASTGQQAKEDSK